MDINGTIGFSEEQAELLEVATRFCREKSPVDKVRALIDDETGYESAIWQEMVELGWLGIAVPEEYGGVGLSLAEVVPVVEQMGRYLMAGPFLATTLAAQAIIKAGSEEQKSALLPRICEGAAASLALFEPHGDWDLTHLDCTAVKSGDTLKLSGTKTFVTDVPSAELIVASVSVDGKPALVVFEASALSKDAVRREVVIDETRRSYRIALDGVEVPASALLSGGDAAALTHLQLAASLLLSAEMCGGAQSCIDYTVEYLNTRKQFGKLIGSYQAVKHPIVDAYVAYEQARSHLYSAAHCFEQQGEGEVATRMAKAQAGTAISYAADRSIQFHGGFGFTYDCDAQLYRRRALWCDNQHGDAVYHRAKLGELLF